MSIDSERIRELEIQLQIADNINKLRHLILEDYEKLIPIYKKKIAKLQDMVLDPTITHQSDNNVIECNCIVDKK